MYEGVLLPQPAPQAHAADEPAGNGVAVAALPLDQITGGGIDCGHAVQLDQHLLLARPELDDPGEGSLDVIGLPAPVRRLGFPPNVSHIASTSPSLDPKCW